MAWRFLLAAVLGAIAYLDRTAAFQLMLHRPLVVATAMGAVFGNVSAGAQVGAVLELLYLARLPVGASIPPDDTGAAMFAGAAAGKFLLPRFGPASRVEFAALFPVLPLIGAASIFSCTRTDRTAPAFYLT